MHAERCRTKRLLSMACATLSNKTNLCENCYNPPYCASRRAEAPGYARRSPPARGGDAVGLMLVPRYPSPVPRFGTGMRRIARRRAVVLPCFA